VNAACGFWSWLDWGVAGLVDKVCLAELPPGRRLFRARAFGLRVSVCLPPSPPPAAGLGGIVVWRRISWLRLGIDGWGGIYPRKASVRFCNVAACLTRERAVQSGQGAGLERFSVSL